MRIPDDISVLRIRSKALQCVRRFFSDRGFIEVETPVRIPVPALELHIDAEESGDWYLRTSPELHMKRLMAEGCDRIFQIGACFRRGERGRLHSPEHTMLEWYRRDADYMDMLVDTKALMAFVFSEVIGSTMLEYAGRKIEIMPVWECFTVEDAYLRFAGWNPVAQFDPDRFDMDLVEKIEPQLFLDMPVVLKDYPVEAAALARCKPGNRAVAERWELYIGGLELANAFSELIDPGEQRKRFEICAEKRRNMGKDAYSMDAEFLSALEKGMPPCGGVALGIDRLIMLLSGAIEIDKVRAFCI